MEYSIEILKRLSLLGNGRRQPLSNDIVESNIKFASDFIIQHKLVTATQQMIDEAIVELSVHRCLVSISTLQPGEKDIYSKVINEHKNVLRMALSGVIPDDLISAILEDQTKQNATNIVINVPRATRTKNMISDYLSYIGSGIL
jgi:hypothetical protein